MRSSTWELYHNQPLANGMVFVSQGFWLDSCCSVRSFLLGSLRRMINLVPWGSVSHCANFNTRLRVFFLGFFWTFITRQCLILGKTGQTKTLGQRPSPGNQVGLILKGSKVQSNQTFPHLFVCTVTHSRRTSKNKHNLSHPVYWQQYWGDCWRFK